MIGGVSRGRGKNGSRGFLILPMVPRKGRFAPPPVLPFFTFLLFMKSESQDGL